MLRSHTNPEKNLQVKMIRSLLGANEFVSYIDATGELDGERRILDRETTTSQYPVEPGLLSLDPQLICHSWVSRQYSLSLLSGDRHFDAVVGIKTVSW